MEAIASGLAYAIGGGVFTLLIFCLVDQIDKEPPMKSEDSYRANVNNRRLRDAIEAIEGAGQIAKRRVNVLSIDLSNPPRVMLTPESFHDCFVSMITRDEFGSNVHLQTTLFGVKFTAVEPACAGKDALVG